VLEKGGKNSERSCGQRSGQAIQKAQERMDIFVERLGIKEKQVPEV